MFRMTYLIFGQKMGIDFSHCDAHLSYSGFNYLRVMLCKAIGLSTVKDKNGFEVPPAIKSTDPLIKFLGHSDCDGYIPIDECIPLAKRLRDTLVILNRRYKGWDSDLNYNLQVEKLIKGLRKAGRERRRFQFKRK